MVLSLFIFFPFLYHTINFQRSLSFRKHSMLIIPRSPLGKIINKSFIFISHFLLSFIFTHTHTYRDKHTERERLRHRHREMRTNRESGTQRQRQTQRFSIFQRQHLLDQAVLELAILLLPPDAGVTSMHIHTYLILLRQCLILQGKLILKVSSLLHTGIIGLHHCSWLIYFILNLRIVIVFITGTV